MLFGKHLNKLYLKYLPLIISGVIVLIILDMHHLVIPEQLGKIVGIFEGAIKTNTPVLDFKNEIGNIVLKVISVAVLFLVCRIGFRFFLFTASTNIDCDLRQKMFEKASKLSSSYYQNNKVGNVISWFTTDLETIEECLGWGSVMIVDATFCFVFVAIKMVIFNWALALVIALPALFILVWGFFVEKIMGKMWMKRQQAFDKLYDYSQENFTGIRVIKAFVKENKEIMQFSKVARENQLFNVNFGRISVLFDIFIEIIIASIVSLILGFGGWFVYATYTGSPVIIFGQPIILNAENLITFTGYFDELIWPLIALGQIFSMRSRAKTSYKRIANFLDTPEDIVNPIDPIRLKEVKGDITFSNFSFRYPSSTFDSLKNVNLNIKRGEVVGIVGKIGSGKTTLVNSLLRLYNVNDGTLYIDGNDIMKCNIDDVRANIAIVPQDNFLFSTSIKENIAFSDTSLSIEETKKAAEFASIATDIDGFADKYDTVLGERGVTISGGQKQRISIARAFIKNAPILILDDSVSAVDTKTEESILANIKKLRKNKTTLVIASRVSTVSGLDKIIVINDGEIEAFDSHENLLKISPTYSKMVYLQTLEAEVEGGK